MRPITFEEFKDTAYKKFNGQFSFPYLETEFQAMHSEITIKCNRCGRMFKSTAFSFYNSSYGNCACKKQKISYDELVKATGLQDIQFFEGVKIKRSDSVIRICPKHGEFISSIASLLKGKTNCRRCVMEKLGKSKKNSVEEFKKRFEETKFSNTITPHYVNYHKMSEPMPFTCSVCNTTFSRQPSNFLNGDVKFACPTCGKKEISEKRLKTNEMFISDMEEVYGKGRYELVGDYVNSSSHVEIHCLKCDRIFSVEANSFLKGHGCPYHNCNSSIKEKELFDFIHNIADDAVNNDRDILNGQELDIYVPSKKIGFEFDGIFWHNENCKPNDYHLSKTILCEEKGIRLFHIFEDEWVNKKEIIKSMIKNLLGETETKIYARNCKINYVDHSQGKMFMENNHLQGWCPSQIMIGLYYNNELVSLMSFGKSRHFIGNGKSDYELLRFCTKCNTQVVGGASKLFDFFIKEHPNKEIVSYADRRWSNGNLYEKLGFELYNKSKPNYFYVIGNERKNRFNFRKSILMKKYGCPEDMSEREFCKQKKWYRIYDCGCLCYRWRKK